MRPKMLDPPPREKPRPLLTGNTTTGYTYETDAFHSRQIWIPSKTDFYRFRAQIDYRHPVDPGTSYTVVARGVAGLYSQ